MEPGSPPNGTPNDCRKESALLQFCVLRFGLLQDGDVLVGVFPQSEKILVRGAALGRVALERVCARQADMGQRTHRV